MIELKNEILKGNQVDLIYLTLTIDLAINVTKLQYYFKNSNTIIHNITTRFCNAASGKQVHFSLQWRAMCRIVLICV